MPQMGYDMQEGTVVRWLKSEGAEVQEGEAIAEIETDKAVVEFESTASGLLRRIVVSEGSSVPVGEVIAIIGDVDEGVTEVPTQVAPTEAPPEESAETEEAPTPELALPGPLPVETALPMLAQDQEARASPVARRLAEERGIDLSHIEGTGPGGRITKIDVQSFKPPEPTPAPVAEPVPAPAAKPVAAGPPVEPVVAAPPAVAGEKVPLSKMRQQIARVVVRSKQEIPHYYISAEIDMTQAMVIRQQINAALEHEGIRVSVNDMIIKACIGALKKHPKFNASYSEDGLQMYETINMGVAIAQEQGLIVPAILDCGDKSLAQISMASKDLIQRAKAGTLQPQEYTGGTFSISNMGMLEVSSFVSIIHPPQAAMLAVGAVSKRPVVRDDEIKIAEMMTTTLSADHRVSDGAEGAQFIVEVKRLLENPGSLLV